MPIIIDSQGLRRAYSKKVAQIGSTLGGGTVSTAILSGEITETFPDGPMPGQTYSGVIAGVSVDLGIVNYDIIIPSTTIGLSFSKTTGITSSDVITVTVDGNVPDGTALDFEISANSTPIPAANGPIKKSISLVAKKNNGAPDAATITWSLASKPAFEETKTYACSVTGGTDPDNDALTYSVSSLNGNVTFSKTANIASGEIITMSTKAVAGSNEIIAFKATDSFGLTSANSKAYSFDIIANTTVNTAPSALTIAFSGNANYNEAGTYYVQISGGSDNESVADMTYNIVNISDPTLLSFNKTTGITLNEPLALSAGAVDKDTPVSFEITCTDSAGMTSADSKKIDLTIKDTIIPNSVPLSDTIVTTLPTTIPENTSAKFVITGGSDTEDGTTLTYRIDTTKTAGLTFSKSIGIKPNEEVTVTAGDVNKDTLVTVPIYTVDTGGLSSTSSKNVTTTIKWVNAAPDMAGFNVALLAKVVPESTIQSVMFTGAVDPENGGAIKYFITNASAQLTFAKTADIADGETIGVTIGAVTTDTKTSFQVYAKDAPGAVSEFITYDVTIINNNGAPVTANINWNGGASIGSGVTQSVNFYGATDPDGDVLTYSISNISGPITFSKTSGLAAYEVLSIVASNVTSVQTATFSVNATDPKGLAGVAKQFSISVNATNKAPITDNITWTGPATMSTGTSADVSFSGATDPENGVCVYSITGVNGPISFSKTSGILTNEKIKINAGAITTNQPASFSVNAIDPEGNSGIAKSFNLTVTYTNKPPETTGISMSGATFVNGGASSTVQFYGATDPDGDALTYVITDIIPGGDILKFSKVGGIAAYESLTITGADTVTADTPVGFMVNASDSRGLMGTAKKFTITVKFVNAAPKVDGITWTGPATINAGASTSVSFSGAVDPNGDKVTYNLSPGTGISFSKTTGITAGESVTMYATNSITADTPVAISVTATDSKGLTSTGKATVNTTIKKAANKAPTGAIVLTPLDFSPSDPSYGGTSRRFTLSGVTDPDGDVVTYSLLNLSGPISFNKTSGILANEPVTLTYGNVSTPTASSVVIASFDSSGMAGPTLSSSGQVVPKNSAPNTSGLSWNGSSQSTYPAGSSTNGSQFYGATDPDGDVLTYEITNVSNYLSFSKLSGISAYENITASVGNVPYNMTLSFTVNARDSKGNLGTPKTFSFTAVKPVAQPPSTVGMKASLLYWQATSNRNIIMQMSISGGSGTNGWTYSLVGWDTSNGYPITAITKNSGILPTEMVQVTFGNNGTMNPTPPKWIDATITDGTGQSAGPVRLYF